VSDHRFACLLTESVCAHQSGHDAKAVSLLDEARTLLLQPDAPTRPAGCRPEDDPTRPAFDREAWRKAKGA
jgi:hypothetical protein